MPTETPPWIHQIQIGYLTDSGQELTLHAELERELHEQLVAAMGHEHAENVRVTVYARRSPTSELRPMLLHGDRIVRVEPIPDTGTLPTFEDIRRAAYAELGDVEDGLRSDWAPGTGPTPKQAARLRDVRLHIARAKTALALAAQTEGDTR